MPFLHWFKRKSESTEDKPILAEKLAVKPANLQEPYRADLQPEAVPVSPPNGPLAADLPAPAQNPAATSELAASKTDSATATLHLSVPIGAFYAKLPPHLLAAKTPNLARFVQIAEEDILLDQATQEVTLPLSILSLSCPEIFIRAVEGAEDVPVTFSMSRPNESEQPLADESSQSEETDALRLPAADALVAGVEGGGEQEITLRLQPILTDFPPQLEPPGIHSLIETQAEITLPLGLILSQLALGRVVVPAEIFCRALPLELKSYFEAIEPSAEIPIPLQEVFTRLPPAAIKLREDQEMDRPEEAIPTPFSEHADEDAKRLSHFPVEADSTTNESSPPKDELFQIAVESDAKRLQAIFMTDEPLDLAKTIQKVAELPGLRSCILSTTDGLKIAGDLADPWQENTILTSLPELFHRAGSKLEGLHAGPLETISLYYGLHQLSTFVQGKLCLTVLHDNRPFKPGVREKIQSIVSELAALGASEKPL